MGMVEEGGVYRSERRRVQRRKKIAVGIAGLGAILAGGGYAVTAWRAAQDATVIGDIGALAPHTPAVPEPPGTDATSKPPPSSAVPAPTSRPVSTRLSGARRSSRPSPAPSPSRIPDDEVAAAQISRLLQAPRSTPSGAAPAGTIVVTNEPGPDGSAIRVLSARYDLTGRGSLLWAADTGQPVGDARCTQNLRVDGALAEARPGLLLCWRVSPVKSVVTVATSRTGSPAAAASARVIDRTWERLG
jgi:hypothetical protein